MNQPTNRSTQFRLAILLIAVAVVCTCVGGWYVTQAYRQQSKNKNGVKPDVKKSEVSGSSQPDDSIDMRSVECDLSIPELETGVAGPGKRVKEVLPDFVDTDVYHVTYLPVDWESGKSYPVIVEYAGNGGYKNYIGDECTGHVEDSKLGYGISAGREFIWICLPFLNHEGTGHTMVWWGAPFQFNPLPTVDYCKLVVPMICEKYGGDPDRVLIAGFSRGSIACNFIGLHDDEIAKLWRGFIPYSHYDGVSSFRIPGLDRDSALSRLKRVGNRPQFICAEGVEGRQTVATTRAYLDSTGINGDFTFRKTGFLNHNDAWVLRPSAARDELRTWVQTILK